MAKTYTNDLGLLAQHSLERRNFAADWRLMGGLEFRYPQNIFEFKPSSGWWLKNHPVEKYAQVKLGHEIPEKG